MQKLTKKVRFCLTYTAVYNIINTYTKTSLYRVLDLKTSLNINTLQALRGSHENHTD